MGLSTLFSEARRGAPRPAASAPGGDAFAPRARRGALVLKLLAWTPVWIPFALFVQLTLFGLRSAVRESHELDRLEDGVEERVEALRAERAALERDLRKLDDPIYRERVRRSLYQAGMEPLTLRRDRTPGP
jgi:hypothetical protein